MKTTLGLTLAAALAIPAAECSVVIDWVTIGDPGNAAQSAANRTHSQSGGDGFGSVSYSYQIAKNETTISQYAAFLNAVAATDTYGLYRTEMASDFNIAGISRSGSSGSYTYSVIGSGNRPITYVSWFDAARFANWMHNGQPTGAQTISTTEDGAYTLNGAMSGTAPARNVGATIWIPTENEWFKAAYYDPTHMSGAGGYWLYANQSDSMSVSFANYQSSFLTNVGAYGTNADSYYGINDMAGNVWEWNDLDAETGSSRGIRNGSWATIGETNLMSSTRQTGAPENENRTIGFRLASIPEPSTTLLTLVFTTGLLCRRKRHA